MSQPNFQISIPHTLGKAKATSKVKNAITKAKKEYADKISKLDEKWSGDIGKFDTELVGFNVSGQIEILSHYINLEAKLPFAALLFKSKIKTFIESEAKKILK